jgi:hypothetical protein
MKTKIQYEWTDYRDTLDLMRRPSSRLGIAFDSFKKVIGIVFLVFVLIILAFSRQSTALALVALIAILMALSLLSHFVIQPMWIRWIFRRKKAWSLLTEIEITEAGIESSNEQSHTQIPWSDFAGRKESDALLILYYSNLQSLILPKRFFTNSQIDTIRDHLIKRGVPQGEGTEIRKWTLIFVLVMLVIATIVSIILWPLRPVR